MQQNRPYIVGAVVLVLALWASTVGAYYLRQNSERAAQLRPQPPNLRAGLPATRPLQLPAFQPSRSMGAPATPASAPYRPPQETPSPYSQEAAPPVTQQPEQPISVVEWVGGDPRPHQVLGRLIVPVLFPPHQEQANIVSPTWLEQDQLDANARMVKEKMGPVVYERFMSGIVAAHQMADQWDRQGPVPPGPNQR